MPTPEGWETDKERLIARDKEREAARVKMFADLDRDREIQERILDDQRRNRKIIEQQDRQRREDNKGSTSSKTSNWIWIIVILAVIYYFGR
jgi:anaerobic C4-dicarboxylate transporter